MLSLADLLLNPRLRTASLKTTKRAVQSLILFYDDIRHSSHLTSLQSLQVLD